MMLFKYTCHRRVPEVFLDGKKTLFITFDDGPDSNSTPKVLEVLAAHQAQATFFVIGERAAKYQGLLKEVLAAGHALGNHSFDHRYRNFFASSRQLIPWIVNGENVIAELGGRPSVGFRSPAGIQTPPLHKSLKQLGMPMVHWDTRFYDAVRPWHKKTAKASLERISSGSIVLLHDVQKAGRLAEFLSTLDYFLSSARAQGYGFQALERRYFDTP